MWFYFFLLMAIVFLLLLYMMPVHIQVIFKKRNKDNDIAFITKTGYGLIKIKVEFTSLKINIKKGKPLFEYKAEIVSPRTNKLLADLNKLFSNKEMYKIKRIYKCNKEIISNILKYLIKKTKAEKLYIKLGFGTGDAAETSLLYGLAWIVAGNMLSFSSQYAAVRQPTAVVVPNFEHACFSLDFDCIISLKLGHIINAGIRAIKVMISCRNI